MSKKRRVFSASFKSKVALAAARGDQTTAQLVAKFAVHSSQVTAWKKHQLAGVPEQFADRLLRKDGFKVPKMRSKSHSVESSVNECHN